MRLIAGAWPRAWRAAGGIAYAVQSSSLRRMSGRRPSSAAHRGLPRELGWPDGRRSPMPRRTRNDPRALFSNIPFPRAAVCHGQQAQGDTSLPRIPLFPTDDMTPEQRRVHDAVVAGPRGEFGARCGRRWIARSRGQISAARRAPALSHLAPAAAKELAILVTGRHCHAQLEWHIHEQMARKAGLPQAVIDDVHAGRGPPRSTKPASRCPITPRSPIAARPSATRLTDGC